MIPGTNLDKIVTIVWFHIYISERWLHFRPMLRILLLSSDISIGDFIFCSSVTSHDKRMSTRTLLLLLRGRSYTDTEDDNIRDSSVAFAAVATGGRGNRVCRSVDSLIPGMIQV